MSASGHFGENTTYVASIRQSYLQLLFNLLGLPMLPNYIDGQFKIKTKIGTRDELTFIGLAGFDDLKLNKEPDDKGDEYLLSYLPLLKQETFTIGATYKHFSDRNIQMFTLSYGYLNNRSHKYLDNDASDPEGIILRSSGLEGKAQMRFEYRSYISDWTVRSGADMSYRAFMVLQIISLRAERSTPLSD